MSTPRPSCTRRSRSCLLLSSVALLAGCGSHATPRLTVTPSSALVDTPLRIVVRGVKSHELVAFRASTVDLNRARYFSQVIVRADARGVARAPMSLLSSMHTDTGGGYIDVVPSKGERVTITADGATATLRWYVRAPDVHEQQVRGPFYGDYFHRPGAPRRPAVLVFGGSEGGLSVVEEAALLASRGFPTLGLAYFKEPGLPQALSRIPLEYFARAARWLAHRTHERRVVVYGVSRGSEAALLTGIDFPQLVRGVVALVPGNVVLVSPDFVSPAWTLHGRPLPFQYELGPTGPDPIPVERLHVPLFMDCGGGDDLWPSCPMARAIAKRRHGDTELMVFPKAGHGVGDLVPNVPQSFPQLGGLSGQANARARGVGWPRLLRFLRAL